MNELVEKHGQDLVDASTDSPFGVWILDRIDEAARTEQPWMMTRWRCGELGRGGRREVVGALVPQSRDEVAVRNVGDRPRDTPNHLGDYDMKIDKAVHEMAAGMRLRHAANLAEQRQRRLARPEPASLSTCSGGPSAERMAHAGDDVETTDGIIDRAGERKPVTRRFRDAPIDRLHRRGWVGEREHRAAEWYLAVYELAGIEPRTVATYGEHGGCGMATIGDRIIGSERAWVARRMWREARGAMPANLAVVVDSVVLHRASPAFANGRQRARYGAMVNRALGPLAHHLGF